MLHCSDAIPFPFIAMTSKHDARVRPTTAAAAPASVPIPKPPVPYIVNACFAIRPHEPSPPFGGSSYHKPDPARWNAHPWPDFEDAPVTVVEQCLQHPPWQTELPSDQAIRRLKVTQQIRCGDPCNAQVVRCDVDGNDLVAKIFDPFYIELEKCMDLELSPTYFAEFFYSCEAAAYTRIRETGLDGKYTPRFEGCWYLNRPIYDAEGCLVAYREVRLILQQFIPGDTIGNMIEHKEVDQIDPEGRMELLDRIMEAQSQLLFIGVQTDDLHPRNLMVWRDANGWQIALIDFSHSRVRDLPTSTWRKHKLLDTALPESPITASGLCWPPRCRGWIPKEFHCDTKESFDSRLKQMRDRWEGSDQYGPVNEEWIPKYRDRG